MKAIPSWAAKLLKAICPPEFYEQIEGDLMEVYGHDVRKFGKRRAWWRFTASVLRFLRPGILLRNRLSSDTNHFGVVTSYLKTTGRHIKKSKLSFAFKLGGLTLSIFCFMVIAIYVSYQLSFDTFHNDYQNIYRVNSQRKENGAIEKYGLAPLALGPMLGNQFPEVAAVARLRFANATYLRHDGVVIDCELLIEADSSLFSVLTFKFLKGDKRSLGKPNSIVLARFIAERIFGSEDPMQKLVTINDGTTPYEVTGVVENMPSNSSLFIGAIVPMRQEHDFTLGSITSPVEFIANAASTYVRFRNGMPDNFDAKVESMLDRYVKRNDRVTQGFRVFFQPMKEIYRGPKYKGELFQKGSSVYLMAFASLGGLLLAVACINYINLSIADFTGRLREIGVRKVLGAQKFQLTVQIVTETVLYNLVAVAMSVLLLYIFFPHVLRLIDTDLRFEMLFSGQVMFVIGLCISGLIFLSAYFPARLLTRTAVTQNLKSEGVSFNSSVSRALLFTQFGISALCICCTLMVGRQVNYIHNKELGFDRKNLLVIGLPEEFSVSKMITFKQTLKQIAGVTGVSNSSFRIGGGYWKDWYFVEDKDQMREVELYEVFSDDELFSTLRMKLLKGRTFDARMPSDSGAAFVINETAARELGWDDPIGKRIYTHPEDKGKWDGTIVGVVADINISSLYESVKPLVMRLPWQGDYPDGFVYVRYEGDDQAIVKSIEKKYNELMPGYPLACLFVDEFYNSRHDKETKAFNSLRFGTLVIVLVSILGIFSLAAYMSARRMKEFGIRKVLGATGKQIAGLHIGYFVRIAMISNVVALPLAYLVVGEWLSTFAYRIDLTVAPFVLVGVLSFLLVIVSGGHAALRAARTNPVDVIKAE